MSVLSIIGIVVAIVGVLASFVGAVMVLIEAFKASILWGLAYIFLPFANIVFVITHWQDAKRGVKIWFFCGLLAGGGLLLIDSKVTQSFFKNAPVTEEHSATDNTQPHAPAVENPPVQPAVAPLPPQSLYQQHAAQLQKMYENLQAERASLNVNDQAAVARFNQHNAEYSAFKKQVDAENPAKAQPVAAPAPSAPAKPPGKGK